MFLKRWKGFACFRFMDWMHTNGDPDGDVVVAAAGTQAATVLLANGDGSYGPLPFSTEVGSPWIAAHDLDHDGHLDLALVSSFSSVVAVHRGYGDGTLSSNRNFPVAPHPTGIAIADWAVQHEDTADMLRGYQEALFGGTPAQQPARYAASSPSTASR